MHSPVVAMLWENWRITRVETAQRLVQGIVLAGGALALAAAFGPIDDGAARLALGLLAMTYGPLWLSVAKLNGGRFMDGYHPGYPFYFLYTRPVRNTAGSIFLSTRNRLAMARNGNSPTPRNTGPQPYLSTMMPV